MSEYIFNTESNDPAGIDAHNGAALVVTFLETLVELDFCLPGSARPLKLPQYAWELTFAHDTGGVLAAVEKRVILASSRGFVRGGVGLGTDRLSSFPMASLVGRCRHVARLLGRRCSGVP